MILLVVFPSALLASSDGSTDYDSNVVVVFPGDEVPYAGLLVGEIRYTELIEAELRYGEATGESKIKQLYIDRLEELYREALEPWPTPWYLNLNLNRALFFVLGGLAVVAAVFAGVKIVEATRWPR